MEFANLALGELLTKPVIWIPLFHNTPMGAYRQGDYHVRPLQQEEEIYFQLQNDPAKSYRFHFRIMPDFRAKFGNYGNPFQSKANLILDSRIYLLSGLSVHAGILFPLNNSLDNQEMNIRPGPAMIQWFKKRGNHFLSTIAGLYLNDRYGLDLQYRYAPLNKYLSFGIESSYTGFYFWPRTGLFRKELNEFTLVGDIEWRLPPYPKISARLSGGQYLFGDRGIRFDVIRQWGTVDVSFYGSWTQGGQNAGFQFIIPIFPGKIIRTKNFELRTAEEFPWEYNFSNEDPSARNYRLSIPRLSDVIRQYNHHLWIHD